jgi:hypothetical protein
MEGRDGAALDFADDPLRGNATDPLEPFGQLIVAAFDQGNGTERLDRPAGARAATRAPTPIGCASMPPT